MAEDADRKDEVDGAALVRRFRDGDESAFAELFERYGGLISHRIERELPSRLRRKVAISDVVQESMLQAFDSRESLREDSERAFRSWLLTIADHKSLEAIRHHEATQKRSTKREVTRAARRETSAYSARQASPSQAAVGAEMHSLAQHAMRRLPPDYREVLRLAQQEHLTLVEAAERMGRSHEATKKLYGRALTRFREEFEKLGGGRA
jgi:RNA polymerase sigma-70 factor (ECF subfamily)